jgi:hypothetical protein
MEFQQDIIDRLARVEVKLDSVLKAQEKHEERHYNFSMKLLFSVLSSGLALLVSLFK